MSSALVSDLHLGTRSGADLLRHAWVRERFLEAVRGADELVLLGDTLELREGPAREALDASHELDRKSTR